jgi:hypothetical protein
MNNANRAFEMTYVDINLPNKQRRQRRIVRAGNSADARKAFAALNIPNAKVITVAEVEAEPRLASLDALATRFVRPQPRVQQAA